MIQIKKTQSIEMSFDEIKKVIVLIIYDDDDRTYKINIPLKKVPQVQRGLFSAIQRFWRKK